MDPAGYGSILDTIILDPAGSGSRLDPATVDPAGSASGWIRIQIQVWEGVITRFVTYLGYYFLTIIFCFFSILFLHYR